MSVNKLTSPQVLSSMDFTALPFLRDMVQVSSSSASSSTSDTYKIHNIKENDTTFWKKGLASAHGDAVYHINRGSTQSSTQQQQQHHAHTEYDLNIRMLQDVYCGQLGVLDLDTFDDNVDFDTMEAANKAAAAWETAIFSDFRYNFIVDGMPTAYASETPEFRTSRYWGGVPVGRLLDGSIAQIYNHWNLQILYRTINTVAGDRYRIVRTVMNAFSIQHTFQEDSTTRTFPVTLQNPIKSCQPVIEFNTGTTEQQLSDSQRQHTTYKMLNDPTTFTSSSPSSPQTLTGQVLFTYDVEWILVDNPYSENSDDTSTKSRSTSTSDDLTVNNRWNVFLSMDGATPSVVLWMGLLIGIFINCLLAGALWTWVMRDLSYKPIYDMTEFDSMVEIETAECTNAAVNATNTNISHDTNHDMDEISSPETAQEIQLWPLSSRVFFPPAQAAGVLAVGTGTGAQLLITVTVFLLLFQFGIVNQSMGANILTPTVILYTVSSVFGGYVTGRLLAVFHWNVKDAIKACLAVATVYPVIGMVTIHMVYDVLPGAQAPNYRVLAHSGLLMAVWLLAVIPLTVAGGVWGHHDGPMTLFPITQGAAGYQDLALQPADGAATEDENVAKWYCCCRNKCRILLLLLVGGVLPVICCFIEYSYGVAGPIYRDYYSEYRFGLVTFFLFCTCAGFVTLLLYYGQLRVNNYSWWWASFATGASSGIYIFILSMSWLFFNVVAEAHIDVSSIGIYFLWFAFLSLGIALITGFVGVACCVQFNRLLYYNAMRRGNQ